MSSWIEAIDPDSNNKYWYNSLTGESTWSDPNDINNDNNNVIETSSSVESASAVSAASYWIEAVDPTTNNIYYYNTLTGESSWDKPLELVNEELNNNNNDDNNNIEEPPLDWIQETDEETNRTFLINPLTNLKGWEIVYDHTSGLVKLFINSITIFYTYTNTNINIIYSFIIGMKQLVILPGIDLSFNTILMSLLKLVIQKMYLKLNIKKQMIHFFLKFYLLVH